MIAAVSPSTELIFLFVVLPFIAAAVVVAIVQRRSTPCPAELRTSHLLEEGEPAEGTLIEWKSPAQSFLDRHPMVTFRVAVDGDAAAPILITQSVPRVVLRELRPGMTFPVRLAPGRVAGAIVFAEDEDED